ncbi:hypothetical protein LTR20_007619 [Exophiala xenobiotica]|nr:hypothetical protein LTS13_007060 [Exophiala xenobiotica]KAK5394774.1 hypothetical protein LTR79_008227 [Exophiala xenobiotica]KAK5409821.1 hypothetical protein LTR90_009012 [Exophiala xenobiotica]KAK5458950.1 hypothetical protein LTR20_007619 [Exophiala xenobiotica]KAK5475263.1 hypothetical protein LTR26_009598 [Exophiala xenobiotica]
MSDTVTRFFTQGDRATRRVTWRAAPPAPAPAAAPCAAAKCHLLEDLSVEIRLKIYQYALTYEHPIFQDSRPIRVVSRFGRLRPGTSNTFAALLCVCKQINAEAAGIVYGSNEFCVDWNTLSLAEPLQYHITDQLKEVFLDCRGGRVFGYTKTLKMLATHAPGIETMTLKFERSARLMAAVVELCNAMVQCSSAFDYPALRLSVDILTRPEVPSLDTQVTTVALTLFYRTLADILPHAGRFAETCLTQFHAPNLREIKLVGRIEAYVEAKIDDHRCPTDLCCWRKVSDTTSPTFATPNTTGRRLEYLWTRLGSCYTVPDRERA